MLVDYLFHPVGQGLMASGHISYIAQHSKRLSGKPVPVFSWIYDCGSISSQKLIQDGLSLVAAKVGGDRPALDLVVISHFDKDHISGLTTLLTNYTVHTLVIPFVPLWQRLAIIFAKDRYIDKAAMPFYLDPVTAISRIKGSKITRIVIIPASSGDGPPSATTDDRGPMRGPEQVSFSEDDCTIQRGLKPLVHTAPDSQISGLLCTKLVYAQYSCAPKRDEHGDRYRTDYRARRGHPARTGMGACASSRGDHWAVGAVGDGWA